MHIVTGASGKLGNLIVRRLAARIAPSQVVAVTRKPDALSDLAATGVVVRGGDFTDPAGLPAAFEGGARLLLVSSNASAHGGDPIAQHRAALAAARKAGVERVVYTSHMGASAASEFAPMHDHATTEGLLAEGGMDWTALRNGFYASACIGLMGDALDTGVLRAPRDGKVAWTTHEDLADAATAILLGDETFDGPTPPLTATDALDFEDVAAVASEATGRRIRRETIPDDALEAAMTARGAPEGAIRSVLGIFRAARAGEFATTDPTLGRLIGRKPAGIGSVISGQMG